MTAAATAAVAHELVQLAQELAASVQRHDRGRLEELLAEEFTLQGAAGQMGREEFLESASGPYEIDEFTYDEIDSEVYGNTAVLVSRYRQVARLDGRDLSHEMHVTDVWVRRAGRWQIVRRHATIAA
jgi:ketosteroid isomerase-like protein